MQANTGDHVCMDEFLHKIHTNILFFSKGVQASTGESLLPISIPLVGIIDLLSSKQRITYLPTKKYYNIGKASLSIYGNKLFLTFKAGWFMKNVSLAFCIPTIFIIQRVEDINPILKRVVENIMFADLVLKWSDPKLQALQK